MISPQPAPKPTIGLYLVFWKGGGTSTASIYMRADGTLCIAPTNWIAPAILSVHMDDIESLEKISEIYTIPHRKRYTI